MTPVADTPPAPQAYIDRKALQTEAYGTPQKLLDRMSIYRYQEPRLDLRVSVREFLGGVPGPVLDLGCGNGSYTRALREAGHAVIATDLSIGMATTAGTPAAVADAMALPYADATFGAAIALHMLYHVPEPAVALAEVRRVTRSGGTVVITTNALDDKTDLRRLHIDAAADVGITLDDSPVTGRFHLDAAEAMAKEIFTHVVRHDNRSEVSVPVADPVVTFIDSTRDWYGDGPEVLPYVRRRAEEIIAREGAFRFRTHSGFLVCR